MKERLEKYAEAFKAINESRPDFPREYTKQEFTEALTGDELKKLVSSLPDDVILRITV